MDNQPAEPTREKKIKRESALWSDGVSTVQPEPAVVEPSVELIAPAPKPVIPAFEAADPWEEDLGDFDDEGSVDEAVSALQQTFGALKISEAAKNGVHEPAGTSDLVAPPAIIEEKGAVPKQELSRPELSVDIPNTEAPKTEEEKVVPQSLPAPQSVPAPTTVIDKKDAVLESKRERPELSVDIPKTGLTPVFSKVEEKKKAQPAPSVSAPVPEPAPSVGKVAAIASAARPEPSKVDVKGKGKADPAPASVAKSESRPSVPPKAVEKKEASSVEPTKQDPKPVVSPQIEKKISNPFTNAKSPVVRPNVFAAMHKARGDENKSVGEPSTSAKPTVPSEVEEKTSDFTALGKHSFRDQSSEVVPTAKAGEEPQALSTPVAKVKSLQKEVSISAEPKEQPTDAPAVVPTFSTSEPSTVVIDKKVDVKPAAEESKKLGDSTDVPRAPSPVRAAPSKSTGSIDKSSPTPANNKAKVELPAAAATTSKKGKGKNTSAPTTTTTPADSAKQTSHADKKVTANAKPEVSTKLEPLAAPMEPSSKSVDESAVMEKTPMPSKAPLPTEDKLNLGVPSASVVAPALVPTDANVLPEATKGKEAEKPNEKRDVKDAGAQSKGKSVDAKKEETKDALKATEPVKAASAAAPPSAPAAADVSDSSSVKNDVAKDTATESKKDDATLALASPATDKSVVDGEDAVAAGMKKSEAAADPKPEEAAKTTGAPSTFASKEPSSVGAKGAAKDAVKPVDPKAKTASITTPTPAAKGPGPADVKKEEPVKEPETKEGEKATETTTSKTDIVPKVDDQAKRQEPPKDSAPSTDAKAHAPTTEQKESATTKTTPAVKADAPDASEKKEDTVVAATGVKKDLKKSAESPVVDGKAAASTPKADSSVTVANDSTIAPLSDAKDEPKTKVGGEAEGTASSTKVDQPAGTDAEGEKSAMAAGLVAGDGATGGAGDAQPIPQAKNDSRVTPDKKGKDVKKLASAVPEKKASSSPAAKDAVPTSVVDTKDKDNTVPSSVNDAKPKPDAVAPVITSGKDDKAGEKSPDSKAAGENIAQPTPTPTQATPAIPAIDAKDTKKPVAKDVASVGKDSKPTTKGATTISATGLKGKDPTAPAEVVVSTPDDVKVTPADVSTLVSAAKSKDTDPKVVDPKPVGLKDTIAVDVVSDEPATKATGPHSVPSSGMNTAADSKDKKPDIKDLSSSATTSIDKGPADGPAAAKDKSLTDAKTTGPSEASTADLSAPSPTKATAPTDDIASAPVAEGLNKKPEAPKQTSTADPKKSDDTKGAAVPEDVTLTAKNGRPATPSVDGKDKKPMGVKVATSADKTSEPADAIVPKDLKNPVDALSKDIAAGKDAPSTESKVAPTTGSASKDSTKAETKPKDMKLEATKPPKEPVPNVAEPVASKADASKSLTKDTTQQSSVVPQGAGKITEDPKKSQQANGKKGDKENSTIGGKTIELTGDDTKNTDAKKVEAGAATEKTGANNEPTASQSTKTKAPLGETDASKAKVIEKSGNAPEKTQAEVKAAKDASPDANLKGSAEIKDSKTTVAKPSEQVAKPADEKKNAPNADKTNQTATKDAAGGKNNDTSKVSSDSPAAKPTLNVTPTPEPAQSKPILSGEPESRPESPAPALSKSAKKKAKAKAKAKKAALDTPVVGSPLVGGGDLPADSPTVSTPITPAFPTTHADGSSNIAPTGQAKADPAASTTAVNDASLKVGTGASKATNTVESTSKASPAGQAKTEAGQSATDPLVKGTTDSKSTVVTPSSKAAPVDDVKAAPGPVPTGELVKDGALSAQNVATKDALPEGPALLKGKDTANNAKPAGSTANDKDKDTAQTSNAGTVKPPATQQLVDDAKGQSKTTTATPGKSVISTGPTSKPVASQAPSNTTRPSTPTTPTAASRPSTPSKTSSASLLGNKGKTQSPTSSKPPTSPVPSQAPTSPWSKTGAAPAHQKSSSTSMSSKPVSSSSHSRSASSSSQTTGPSQAKPMGSTPSAAMQAKSNVPPAQTKNADKPPPPTPGKPAWGLLSPTVAPVPTPEPAPTTPAKRLSLADRLKSVTNVKAAAGQASNKSTQPALTADSSVQGGAPSRSSSRGGSKAVPPPGSEQEANLKQMIEQKKKRVSKKNTDGHLTSDEEGSGRDDDDDGGLTTDYASAGSDDTEFHSVFSE